MKRFLIYFLSLTIPYLSLILCVNYFVDPGNVYDDEYVYKIIDGVSQGENVTNVQNKDERLYKRMLVEVNNGKKYDYVVWGPSQIMTLSEDVFPGKSFLNLGMSSSTIEDYISMYVICKENNLLYDNLIIAPLPTLYNPNNEDARWETNARYYYQYYNTDNKIFVSQKNKNLFSVSYFKTAVKSLFSSSNKDLVYTELYVNEQQTERPDGSLYYGVSYINKPQNEIDNSAKVLSHESFNKFNAVSKVKQESFEQLINNIIKDGVNVYFYLSPSHPYSYELMMQNLAIIDAENRIVEFAKDNNIQIIGSYNPLDLGFKNSSFYDGMHVRKELVDSIFICAQLF